MIVDGIRDAQPDAVYLDLHGAMVAEHQDDGEGELLAARAPGRRPGHPIVASLDLHANVTAAHAGVHADTLVAYRTYPHVDMADTGARVAFLLAQRADGMARPVVAARRMPFLIPLSSQSPIWSRRARSMPHWPGWSRARCPPSRSRPVSRRPISRSAGRWCSPMAPAQAARRRPRTALAREVLARAAHSTRRCTVAEAAVRQAMQIAQRATARW
jgi:hypothetical protein